ncbi:hypothetical protein L810_7843 [Burkholderia sp. AU4i]|nr:hypothetical protein L810_7843 [Burkholderia sp. AU4i]
MSEATNLAGHYGKTLSLFASASSLNRRVKCEDIGLESQFFDKAGNLRDSV